MNGKQNLSAKQRIDRIEHYLGINDTHAENLHELMIQIREERKSRIQIGNAAGTMEQYLKENGEWKTFIAWIDKKNAEHQKDVEEAKAKEAKPDDTE